MANNYEYVKASDAAWSPFWNFDLEEDLRCLLGDWGIARVTSVQSLESWYESTHASASVSVAAESDTGNRFRQLKREWIRGTEKISILSQIVLHPAYQQIIAMSPVVIPFILGSLEQEVDHWFWALKNLNKGVDVAEGTETMAAAAEAWIVWGRENGHLDSRD